MDRATSPTESTVARLMSAWYSLGVVVARLRAPAAPARCRAAAMSLAATPRRSSSAIPDWSGTEERTVSSALNSERAL